MLHSRSLRPGIHMCISPINPNWSVLHIPGPEHSQALTHLCRQHGGACRLLQVELQALRLLAPRLALTTAAAAPAPCPASWKPQESNTKLVEVDPAGSEVAQLKAHLQDYAQVSVVQAGTPGKQQCSCRLSV